jgi:hypothetical protein
MNPFRSDLSRRNAGHVMNSMADRYRLGALRAEPFDKLRTALVEARPSTSSGRIWAQGASALRCLYLRVPVPQPVGLAVGSDVCDAVGPAVAEGDGAGDDVPLTSASTRQFRRSSSIRPWMDCSLRTMSSSCCRFTAESAGPTSLKIVATSWASLITRTQAALTRAPASPGGGGAAGDGAAGAALCGAEKSGVVVFSKPTSRTPTAMPATKVSTGIHQRDRRRVGMALSSRAWCFASVPATWRLLGWSG